MKSIYVLRKISSESVYLEVTGFDQRKHWYQSGLDTPLVDAVNDDTFQVITKNPNGSSIPPD